MKYEGEVKELELIPALVELSSEGFTGALRFENDSIIKIVYFKDGAVLSASTNDRADSIDEILLKSGKVSRDHVKQALTKRKDDETLGDALLGLGFITRKELTWARRVQLIGILRSINMWDAGSYTLVADYLPKREDGPSFALEQVILELVLTDSDRSKYDALLDSGAAVFRPSALFEEKFPSLGLNQEAAGVVHLINGSRSASDVVSESTSDAFNVYKLMHALNLLGLLEKASGSPAAGMPQPKISPTIEMPMDFGIDVNNSESSPPPDDYDFGTPSGPGVDLSWQQAAEPEPTEVYQKTDLLPSIGDSDYSTPEPVMPEINLPSVLSTEDLPREDREPEPAPPMPAPKKPAPQLRTQPAGSGAGRKIAFAVVGVVIIAALAYAGWVYFMKPGEEPAGNLAATTPAPVGASAQAETATEATTPESVPAEPAATATEPVVETPVETAPAKQSTPPPPPPAPKPTPKPAPTNQTPPSGGGQYVEMARQNAADARGVPYTVQFALLCQDYSIENAMKVGGSDFWFVPINYQGKSCYRAFWGRYASRADAEKGATTVPSALRGGKAVVVQPANLSN